MYYRPSEIQNFLDIVKNNPGFAFLAVLLILGVLWFNYSQRRWVNLSKQAMSSIYLVIVILNVFYLLVSTTHTKDTETKTAEIDKTKAFADKMKTVMNKFVPTTTTDRHARHVTSLQKKIVAANQQWKCAHCGNMLDETYEADHIVPLCEGGDNSTSNLQALCPICHRKKTLRSYLK